MNSINRISLVPILLVLLLAACNRTDEDSRMFDNVAYLDVAAYEATQNATFKKTLTQMDETVSVNLAYPSDSDTEVELAIDPSLVEEYNHKFGTTYESLPGEHFSLSTDKVSIAAGRVASETFTLHFSGLDALEIDKPYLCPLTIVSSSVKPLSASRTAYYVLKKSSALTSAINLSGNWIEFPTLDTWGANSEPWNGLHAVTYECLVRFNGFSVHNDINSVMGVEQYLLLRIGDASFTRDQIQFDGSGVGFGKFPAKSSNKSLSSGVWYHLAVTCDQATGEVCIYVNGELQSYEASYVSSQNINLAMRALYDSGNSAYENFNDAYQFFIGRSYDDTRDSEADFAEVRVWSVARSQQEINENMYSVDPSTPGLIGYWKCDEDEGNIIHDSSPLGNDGVSHTTLVWPSDIEIPLDL